MYTIDKDHTGMGEHQTTGIRTYFTDPTPSVQETTDLVKPSNNECVHTDKKALLDTGVDLSIRT